MFLGKGKETDSEPSEKIKWAEGYFRVNVVCALDKSGMDSENVMQVLLRSLEDSETWVRNAAANALGNFGSKAKGAVPGLLKALEDQDHSVRENAGVSFGED